MNWRDFYCSENTSKELPSPVEDPAVFVAGAGGGKRHFSRHAAAEADGGPLASGPLARGDPLVRGDSNQKVTFGLANVLRRKPVNKCT